LLKFAQKEFRLVFTIVILIAVLPLHAGTYHYPPFVYYYNGVDGDKVIDDLDKKLKVQLPKLETALGIKLKRTAHIYLTQTREEFNRLTRGRAPRWAGGIAYPQQWKIVVKAPHFFGQGVPLEVLTIHEIIHLLLHKAAAHNYIPRWFDEGFAVLLSGEARTGSLARLGRAAAARRLMGLPRVDNVLRFSSPDADLAYAEARSAAAYLIDRFGWTAVRDLLKYVRQDRDFEEAFFLSIGVDYEVFQVEWIEYAENRYRWVMLLEIDNMIWIGIVLLASVAVIAVYFRRRRQLKKWTEEEEDEDEWDRWDTPWDKSV